MNRKYDCLTPEEKEQLAYDYINSTCNDRGYPPTIREIQKFLNVASTSTVHEYITKLVSKGLISLENGKARTLCVNTRKNITQADRVEAVQLNDNSLAITIKLDSTSLLTLDKYCNAYNIEVDEAIKIAIRLLK